MSGEMHCDISFSFEIGKIDLNCGDIRSAVGEKFVLFNTVFVYSNKPIIGSVLP